MGCSHIGAAGDFELRRLEWKFTRLRILPRRNTERAIAPRALRRRPPSRTNRQRVRSPVALRPLLRTAPLAARPPLKNGGFEGKKSQLSPDSSVDSKHCSYRISQPREVIEERILAEAISSQYPTWSWHEVKRSRREARSQRSAGAPPQPMIEPKMIEPKRRKASPEAQAPEGILMSA